jgi:glucosamine 6-phosphate synthetase-like amidotransferase/phosphosugar isomerase protein
MCGIVGATAQRNVYKILIEGLHRLEYRGYDSAGLSILDSDNSLQTRKTVGKVADLEAVCKDNFVSVGDPRCAEQYKLSPASIFWCLDST